jgi:uncharacterized protein YcbK (DUF882 family)
VSSDRELAASSATSSGSSLVSPHFSRRELQCPHCLECFVRPRLLEVLERVRTEIGRPLPVVSGYRCPVHNHAAGGATNSQHVFGAAADIPLGLATVAMAARAGAVGIGTQGAWVRHLDVRDGTPARWRY